MKAKDEKGKEAREKRQDEKIERRVKEEGEHQHWRRNRNKKKQRRKETLSDFSC